jgi:HK97 family phage major capsid protein
MSRNALFAAQPALDKLIIRHLTAALMARLDDGMLNGSGSGAEPRGLRSTTGIGTVVGGTDGAQLAWSHLVDLEAAPAAANTPEAAAGWLFNGATRKWLRKTARGSGLDFILPADLRLLGHPAVVSNNVPSNLTKGSSNGVCSSVLFGSDWSALAAVFYGPVAIDLLVDRVTLADVGKVRIVAAIYVGAGCLSPGCFAKMDDALTA